MQCPKCGNENSPDAKFCRACGNKLEGTEQGITSSLVKCPKCGHANESGKKYCPKCGTPVTVVAPIPETSVPVPPPAAPVPNHTVIQPTPVKRDHRRIIFGIVIVVVVLLCALIGYWYYPKTATLVKGKHPSVSTAKVIRRDGRFIAYDNGAVLDTQINLMWAAKDNGSKINWHGAKKYCENYRGGGYTDWRMPTQGELAGLYDAAKTYETDCGKNAHLTELIRLTCIATWASETRDSAAYRFFFDTGTLSWLSKSAIDPRLRALPVRFVNVKKVIAKGSSLLGEWVNVDPNTRSYKRLIIRSEGNMTFIHFYASSGSSQTEYDVGEAQCSAAMANTGLFTVTQKLSFKDEEDNVGLLDDGRLSVTSHVVFTDNSGRKPYSMTNIFKKTEVVAGKKAKKAKKAK